MQNEKTDRPRRPEFEGLRIGADVPYHLGIREQIDFIQRIEGLGYDDTWAPEVSDPDAFAVCAAAATVTSRIRMHTGITQLGTRTVPLLAASAATVSDLSGGRFDLGVGVSTPVIIGGWHGQPFARPRERMSEALPLLRSILAGERSRVEGRQISSKGFQLRHPPADRPRLILAAMNKKMLETGGELADGVLLGCLPVDAVARVLAAVDRGIERRAEERPTEIAISLAFEVTDDVEQARAQFAEDFAFYLTAPSYRSALAWYGLEEEVAIAEKAWETRDFQKVREAVSDRLIDAITMFGSADECRARVAEYGAAGITSFTFYSSDQNREATLAALAPYGSERPVSPGWVESRPDATAA